LDRIAMPMGGIGTGTVSLGGRGDLRDWEIVNRPAKSFAPRQSFFAIWIKPAGGQAVTRCLEGAIPVSLYDGTSGNLAGNYGLPRFRNASFAAAYPLGQVHLSDPAVPVRVRLEAMNPLIPGDSNASGIPFSLLRYVLTNTTNQRVEAAVCGSVENFIGRDGTADVAKDNVNTFRTSKQVSGVFMTSDGVSPSAEQWGTMALATTATSGVSHRTAWADVTWGDTLLDFWDDFSVDGKLDERERGKVMTPMASLAVRISLPPKATRSVTFLLAWHFPNRQTWTPKPVEKSRAPEQSKNSISDVIADDPNRVGNYYATQYKDAWDVATRTARDLEILERQTIQFVQAFCDSDLPSAVKEAALFNLSTLRSQTVFRTDDGLPFGWEGCYDNIGSCFGSCTHVWNYEQAMAHLFGDLSRQMRVVEFEHATDDIGKMSFRVDLPLSRPRDWEIAAADGQMGCLMKLYRDWKLLGDSVLLKKLWPKARKALEFCWIDGGWDADRDGVMEGCQHNTMDVEYFGPNPQMQGWYLGALRASEEMAKVIGDAEFEKTCRTLFAQGSQWMDQHLFNGEYYEHEIRPIADAAKIAKGLRHESMGAQHLVDPELQLGAGCLIDQLAGQFMSHVAGLGYLHDRKSVRKTLSSLIKYNFKPDLWDHFNHLRTFALQDEVAMIMCSYPKGRRPKRPFPYYNEVMTGFEYTAAVGMLYEGMEKQGLKMIEAIRARYDGAKRNPFDEEECGHHYARAMASWGAVLAISGFDYSAMTQTLTFAARVGKWFWSNGAAWGTCDILKRGKKMGVKLVVMHGEIALATLKLTGHGECASPSGMARSGESITVLV